MNFRQNTFMLPLMFLTALASFGFSSSAMPLAQESKTSGALEAIQTDAQIFDYYDSLVVNFKEHKTDLIVGALAPKYLEGKLTREQVVNRWRTEPVKRGKYDNGPTEVLVSKLVISGDKAMVQGFWAGSWRAFPDSQDHSDAGMTWEGTFIAEWQKTTSGWLETKLTTYDIKDDFSKSDITAAHKALKERYGKVSDTLKAASSGLAGKWIDEGAIASGATSADHEYGSDGKFVSIVTRKIGQYTFDTKTEGTYVVKGDELTIHCTFISVTSDDPRAHDSKTALGLNVVYKVSFPDASTALLTMGQANGGSLPAVALKRRS